ncbi:hypothetical protein [Dactylosporangium darangshiense]|uniref:Integral membrane protein n=1 Tax=Dactylosporangium darangshiense TaxID=579108 RepID=A0ABP8CZG1_9ACTN
MTVEPVRPARPAQVRVAVWLQLTVVALLLGVIGLVVSYAVHFDQVITDIAARFPGTDPDEVSSARSDNVASTLFVCVPALLVAAWYSATAVPLLRGSNVARILMFVAGGGLVALMLTQFCAGLPFALLTSAIHVGDGVVVDTVYEDQGFLDALYNHPDTFGVAALISGIGAALLVIGLSGAVVLLLALPPASRYFVPPKPVPPPLPMPFAYFPVYPGHPAPGGPAGPMPYMICPDPSAHLAPRPTEAHPAPTPAEAPTAQEPDTGSP